METIKYEGGYIIFKTLETSNSKGKKVVWEYITRRSAQGVDIIAELGNKFVINIEKRYPVDSYVISFPGGICDNEDVTGQAVKELREETGYTPMENSEVRLSPILYIDPWKSTEKSQFAHIQLASKSEESHQELEELEDIHNKLIEKDNLLSEITEMSAESGYKLDARLYAYALGKSFASKYLIPSPTS